ncbi:MAG: kinase/pyrophosphorylase, partial [Coriobacteriia bacterium]|nr:kinase/pyrophosphorylase [Coriobacteriia bacterium]
MVTIHLLSDSLGETADAVARAVAAQFPPGAFRLERLPKVDSAEQLREMVASHCGEHCIFFYTLIEEHLLAEMRQLVSEGRVRGVDILGPGIELLAGVTNLEPRGQAGAIRQA